MQIRWLDRTTAELSSRRRVGTGHKVPDELALVPEMTVSIPNDYWIESVYQHYGSMRFFGTQTLKAVMDLCSESKDSWFV